MKKGCIVLFLMLISLTTVYAQAAESAIRVGLFYGSTAQTELSVSCAGGITAEVDGVTYGKSSVFSDVKITVSNGTAQAAQDGKQLAAGACITVSPFGTGYLALNGKEYRGALELSVNSAGKLAAVNVLPMEEYLKAVVPKEVSASWNMEALKAQAVCARTYTMNFMGKHKKDGFDLCATEDCQMYGGVAAEEDRTNQAVAETAGELVLYNGQPAQVFYFATSGGYTEDVKYVWGSEFPYLTAVEDSYESTSSGNYRWTVSLSREKLTELCTKFGYGVGTVQSVEVLESSPNGSATLVRITGDQGTKEFKRESCRTFLGYGMLKSQAYTISGGTQGNTLYATGGTLPQSFTALTADGAAVVTAGELHLQGSEKTVFQATAQSGDFLFSGRGNGHLVGMSQNGSKGMADAGFTYQEILTHYFRNTRIGTL